MQNLEKYIYTKLDAMQTEKAKSTTVPKFVTKAEFLASVDKDIRDLLNRMFKEKKIKVHKTIHSPIQDFVELVKEMQS